MILHPTPICSTNFTFSKNTFIAEASRLGKSFVTGRVYDDACDEGFTIISERTGNPTVFALHNVEMNEGDIMAWEFKCVTPGLKNLKAVIFND